MDKLNTMLTSWHGAGDSTTRLTAWLAARRIEDGALQRVTQAAFPGATATDAFNWFVGDNLLADAVLVLDASHADPAGQVLRNVGTGGSALDATFGSTAGVDGNDPLVLGWAGTNYLYLPGVATNYASPPDTVPLRITGDLELVAWAYAEDWSPVGAGMMIGKENSAGLNRGYGLGLNSIGTLLFRYSLDGTTLLTASSSIVVPFTDGTPYWVKVTRNSTTGQVIFYYAVNQPTEPSSWTQLGGAVAGTAGSLFAAATPLTIGNTDGALPWVGGFYRAIVRNGIGGVTVFDANFTTGITSGAQVTFTESSANAATVTIIRAAGNVRKSVAVTRPVLAFALDDYLEVADNALLNMGIGQSFTVMAVIRQWDLAVANLKVVSKGNFGVPSPGWMIYNNGVTTGSKFLVSDATAFATADSAVAPAFGALNMMCGVRDVPADLLRSYNNGTVSNTATDPTTTTSLNTLPMRIGCEATTTGGTPMEFVAAAIWRRALTATEIATLAAAYGAT